MICQSVSQQKFIVQNNRNMKIEENLYVHPQGGLMEMHALQYQPTIGWYCSCDKLWKKELHSCRM